MESVLAELYEALGQLRYPEIAKIEAKDLATTVFTGQNRVTLLTWLLSRASPTLSAHLEKFQGKHQKDEVVKCYIQMGITNDDNSLLGNCSAKQQLPTLKSLLLFTRSLDSTETPSINDSAIYEVLDKHVNETVNIIPPACNVSMKLTDSEAKKYLEEMRKNESEVVCVTPGCERPGSNPLAVKDSIELNGRTKIENGQVVSLDSVAEAFSAAFESPELWRNSKSSDSPIKEAVVIDETVQTLYKDLSSISQVFESKKSILGKRAPKCLDKIDTPLSLLIEDNVIFSEEIRCLYDRTDLED